MGLARLNLHLGLRFFCEIAIDSVRSMMLLIDHTHATPLALQIAKPIDDAHQTDPRP